MSGEKKIMQLPPVRCDEGLISDLRAFCNERGVGVAEAVRRAIRALITPAQPDDKPGVVAKARAIDVSTTNELGPDILGAPSRSLAR